MHPRSACRRLASAEGGEYPALIRSSRGVQPLAHKAAGAHGHGRTTPRAHKATGAHCGPTPLSGTAARGLREVHARWLWDART